MAGLVNAASGPSSSVTLLKIKNVKMFVVSWGCQGMDVFCATPVDRYVHPWQGPSLGRFPHLLHLNLNPWARQWTCQAETRGSRSAQQNSQQKKNIKLVSSG